MSNGTVVDCSGCNGLGHVKSGAHENLSNGQRQFLGGAGGVITGFAAGGPVGAVVLGAIGVALATDENDDGLTGN